VIIAVIQFQVNQQPSNMTNPAKIRSSLEAILAPHAFELANAVGPGPNSMGGWYSEYHTNEFVATISQDRSNDTVSVCMGSRIRVKPSAHMRGPWSLSHLRGYIDGSADHYVFRSIGDQFAWLRANLDSVLHSNLLNSEELNQWSISASRRMFGQTDEKNGG